MSWTFHTHDDVDGVDETTVWIFRDAASVWLEIRSPRVLGEHLRIRLDPEEADVFADAVRATAGRIRVNLIARERS